MRGADPQLLTILERHAHERSRAPDRHDLIAQLRAELGAALAARSSLDTETIARALAISPRTIWRRLAEVGTSFSAVLDGLRREMAQGLLDAGQAPTSVGQALGFSDERAFGRAFRRWYGVTPTAYCKARP